MAKATSVWFEGIWSYNNKTRMFRVNSPQKTTLWVESFEDGVATIDPVAGCSITSFAELVAGCFCEESNFENELLYAFGCKEGTEFTGIKFTFNGATLLVTKENADADKIYAEWQAEMEAERERYRLEREAYMKTPEYRAERAKELKIATRAKTVQEEVVAVDESTELLFKDEEAAKLWEQTVEINSKDGYSSCVVRYARRWGKYMQHLMEKHNKTVVDVAENASHVTDIDGITGFMYGCAVNILAQCWKYGEELRRWHNKEWGHEDSDGVVNPAVLTIG